MLLVRFLLLFSHSAMSDSLWPHGQQHTVLACPLPSPRVCSSSWLLNGWCHPTISSSVIPFSSHLQSFQASRCFLVSWLFASGGQSIGASDSVLPMNIQDWFPLGWTGWISLQSKGLASVFSNTAVQKHQFFGSKITADGDCSHEIKRRLLLGRKATTNLDNILKSRDITLPTKVPLVKLWFFH